ncbi:hypothetical protein A2U01_0067045, partial [Trifolium medium]|nr:hypothetical protein [Trifolium medium]
MTRNIHGSIEDDNSISEHLISVDDEVPNPQAQNNSVDAEAQNNSVDAEGDNSDSEHSISDDDEGVPKPQAQNN